MRILSALHHRHCESASALIVAMALAAPAGATEIGSVAAANQRIDGTPPGQPSRVLELGNRVFADELIISSDIGSGQFVFLDQTTLTVSPGSEILLDRYVYDPGTGTGEMALTLSKGVLRFIGGKMTKTGEATVQTPHATIGIRGGIAAITVGVEGTNAVFFAGVNMCLKGATKSLCISRPGGMATVKSSKDGTAPDSGGTGTTGSGGSTESTGDAGTPSQAAGSDLGEPEYVGVASPEQISQIYNSTDTGGDGGTTQSMQPQVVASASSSAGLTDVGGEAANAPSEPPVSTQGDEEQPEATETESQSETTDIGRSDPENTATSDLPEEIIDDMMGGVKSDISTLGTSGFATFVGSATASINEVGQGGVLNFQQTGGFVMTYDFGDRSGAATITGLVDTTFTSIITEANAAPGEHFGGTLTDISDFSNVGTVDGSFFTQGADTSASTAGAFDFARQLPGGVDQSADGTFQADKLN